MSRQNPNSQCDWEKSGPSWSRVNGTTSADVTAAVKPAGEARPPGFDQYSATSESKLAKFWVKLHLGPLGLEQVA